MQLKRWPRKNDPASIRARQEALGVDGLVTSIDLEQFAGAAETVTGVAVIPVSVVPIGIELGAVRARRRGRLSARRVARPRPSTSRSPTPRAGSPSR